ncbi:MAG: SPOR domain-containing protein [Pseudomonadota bacterium]
MNNDVNENQYTQYSQNPYQQSGQQSPDQAYLAAQPIAPQEPEKMSIVRKVTRFLVRTNVIGAYQNRPFLATLTLFAAGIGFAAFITSGLSGDETQTSIKDVPVIMADTEPFKKNPTAEDQDTAAKATDESTIFTVMRDDAFTGSAETKVRNLLAPETEEKPVMDKLASFEESAEKLLKDTEKRKAQSEQIAKNLNTTEPASGETKISVPTRKPTVISRSVPNEVDAKTSEILRKAEKSAPKKPDNMHAAGASPETLAFVRSVLDNKDSDKKSDELSGVSTRLLNKVEPAAGDKSAEKTTATTTKTVANITNTGSFFVQLGSVTSKDGAESAWKKFAAEFGLEGSSHRIQEANLGARGTFYRIQAGPFDETKAYDICKDIKAKKPSGCLVVN